MGNSTNNQCFDSKILSIIKSIANHKLSEISELGYAREGNNGSYFCEDTPVRNSAHWCVSYSILYNLTGDSRYIEGARILADYIVREQRKNANGTVKCMVGNKYDSINGLIGQAWAIEGLIETAKVLNDDTYYNVAEEIFLSQKFRHDVGYWERIDINNNNLGFDPVFNHQLWFAASGVLICSYKEDELIHKQLDRFMEKCSDHFRIRKSGLICHYGNINKMNIKAFVKKVLGVISPNLLKRRWPDKFSPYAYEASYHLFNLYGFALIEKYLPGYSFFQKDAFRIALKIGLDIERINKYVNVNTHGYSYAKFSYGYNSPAFEYGFVEKVFTNNYTEPINRKLWNIQMEYCYSKDRELFSNNNDDPETLTARVYEFLRLFQTYGK